MPIAADHHRNLFSRRDHHLTATMAAAVTPYDRQIDSFNRHVTAAMAALSSSPNILSLQWLETLLDSFLQIHEEFRALLFAASPLSAALRRPISDHLDRFVKALDLLNAVGDGIDQVKASNFTASIAVAALHHRQLRRAKKSLADLALSISDPDPIRRTRSTIAAASSSSSSSSDHHHHRRSQSWTPSRSWSKQLQSMGANLTAPRAAEIAATSGLAVPVHTMGCVLHFVMWALLAAIPGQERTITAQTLRSNYGWSTEMHAVYEKVSEESRRRRNCGLLREVEEIERRGRRMMEGMENGEGLVNKEVEVLKGFCEGFEKGLERFERQVREVFHGIVRSRSEGLDYLSSHRH